MTRRSARDTDTEFEMMQRFKIQAGIDEAWHLTLAAWALEWTTNESWLALPGKHGRLCNDFSEFLVHRHGIDLGDLRRAQNAWQRLLKVARATEGVK